MITLLKKHFNRKFEALYKLFLVGILYNFNFKYLLKENMKQFNLFIYYNF